MVLDTSALVAILSAEPEAPAFVTAISRADSRLLSAASFLELAIVIETRYGLAGGQKMDELIHMSQVKIIEVTREQAEVARQAYRTYGKGRHPAGLNFGDCFSYALAKMRGEPLLCKGSDFTQTDVEVWRLS